MLDFQIWKQLKMQPKKRIFVEKFKFYKIFILIGVCLEMEWNIMVFISELIWQIGLKFMIISGLCFSVDFPLVKKCSIC